MTAFLANENIPKATVEKLRSSGYDVVWVSSDFPSVNDDVVLLYAAVENRVVITFDRDYGELIFRKGMKPPLGVIFLRIDEFRPEEPAELLLKYLQASPHVFEKRFSVVTKSEIRQQLL